MNEQLLRQMGLFTNTTRNNRLTWMNSTTTSSLTYLKMGLLGRTKLVLTSLLDRPIILSMDLPGGKELVLTVFKIDLQTNFTIGLSGLLTELQTDTLIGNMGKFSCFKLKPASHANNFFEETDTLLLILALGLMELSIDIAISVSFFDNM